MSGYLERAKRVMDEAPPIIPEKELAQQRQRKLENAGRRGLVVRWSGHPDWLALHDPLTGEWHELRASDCLPSLVEEANGRRKEQATKKTKDTKEGTLA